MHKYNVPNIKDITCDSKQRIDNFKLRVLTSFYRIQHKPNTPPEVWEKQQE